MQEKILGKREISLALLIGCAILLPSLGASIRIYIELQEFGYFVLTLIIIFVLFFFIIKNIKVVLAVNTR